MERYIPQVGEMVRVEVYGEVNEVRFEKGKESVFVLVKTSESGDKQVYLVPLVCCEPFDAVKDSERSVST